ncbi:nucleoside-diphosphate sugar epimerase/dehydratase [Candidatus Cryosericum septentrionale]|jgi:FlaA1/EpsC-like NDP-sugar epimerase|uniref:Polysaccharide biosynthesis protein n=1 Tax=Candidatus Cryosericum septentrionale TaxID=2290913 RepID=A0A398DV65_9BACT|nr:nucleoside-diphosphate sugar epimerase/dehydratase [Candidatus Cryosericum septentrionale]RIE15998.1 polysaccharide biosynthesis protein [Candidatus Cryosericum septentrionale]
MMPPIISRTRRSNWIAAIAKLLIDLELLNLATVLAVLVRVDFRVTPQPWVYTLRFPGLVENLVFVAVSVLLQTPRALWSYASLRDVERVALVVAVTKVLALTLLIAMRAEVQWSWGAFAVSAVLTFLFMAAVRLLARWRYEHTTRQERVDVPVQRTPPGTRVLVVGAGDAGDKVLREFEAHPGLGKVVGLIDDDPAKRGYTIRGVRVRGPVATIADTVRRTGATQAVIAIPSHAAAVTRAVLSNLADTDVQVRTLPGMWELVDGSIHVDDLRPIRLEDLLSRVPISTDMGPVRAYVEGKRILVTGAGGSIGSEIVRQVAELNPSQVIMLGRGENRIFRIDRELREHEGVTCAVPVIGDMRDEARMTWLFDTYRPDIIFHAAAHKHVPLMEQNPEEAILNNVGGTRTLLRLAASHGAERFVNISTDKAVNPVNFMGASKRVVELVVQVNDGREHLRATSVRFGNVLGSKGSVTEVFQKQLQESRTLRVTDPNMERFFMLIPEAVQLVLQAGALAQGRDIFVLRMGEPIRILDLARSYIKLAGLEVGRDASIVITGNRGNEKMTEELWSSTEHVAPTSNDSIMRVECPTLPSLAVLRQAVDALLNATRSHDTNAMRAALHAIDPSINIP